MRSLDLGRLNKRALFFAFVVIEFAANACITHVPSDQKILNAESSIPPPTIFSPQSGFLTSTTTVSLSQTSETPQKTVKTTMVPSVSSPTPQPDFLWTKIEPGNLISATLDGAFYSVDDNFYWSDDGKDFYYKFWHTDMYDNRVLYQGWAAYDLVTRLAMTVTSPTPSYLSVWQDLGIEAPKNADQRGFVSPSGKQVLYPVLFERDASNPYGRSEIRLAAASQEKESLLLKLDWRAELSQIQWLPDESGVFFDIPQEGGGAVVYRVDVQTGEVQRLEDISEFDGWSFGWELSPDGTLLAVTGSDGLYMIDLENGHAKRIEEKAIGLHWSKDSRRIYYWKSGPSYEMCFEDAEATNLRLYDRDTENVDTLIEASEFAEFEKTLGVSLKCSPFLVSPDEKYVAFKPGELWMLALNDTQR